MPDPTVTAPTDSADESADASAKDHAPAKASAKADEPADTSAKDTQPDARSPGTPPAAPVDLDAITRERDQAKRDLGKMQKQLEKLQAAAKEREDAEKSELERANERVAEMESQQADLTRRYQETRLRAAAQADAIALGYRRPERAYREIDMAELDLGDDGEPKNLRQLLEQELKARPELKAAAAAAPDAGLGDRGKTTLSLEAIKGMTSEQINERWEEVSEVLGRPGR